MGNKLNKPFTLDEVAKFICENQYLNYYEDDDCIIMYSDTEKIVNGEAVDRTQDADYITEQKKLSIQQAKEIRDKAYSNITNSILLDQLAINELDLKLSNNIITQVEHDAQKVVYNNRIAAKAALFATVKSNFYTTTGLTEPTITV